MKLENKTAIITGAGSGIGKATALLFAREGAKIIIADWSDEGKNTAEEIGKNSYFIKTDVSRAKDIDNMAKLCLDKFGKIDILVNNAGIARTFPLHETPEEEWDQTINVNLKGAFLASKKVIPEMIKQGKGKIVNISSIAGLVGFSQASAYCASKGGLISLTREMAVEYAKEKINVNCIAPGIIETAMTKEMLQDNALRKSFEEATPYPRLGQPEDIAYAILYLSSSESDFVTGQVLTADGGWTAK